MSTPTLSRVLQFLYSDAKRFDRFLWNCSPAVLMKMTQVNRQVQHTVFQMLPRRFDVNRRLARFFTKTTLFRSIQHGYDILISGSFALQLLAEVDYDTDLDLYVPRASLSSIVIFLLSEDYRFVPYAGQPRSLGEAMDVSQWKAQQYQSVTGLAAVLNFEKATECMCQPRKVQLMLPQKGVNPLDLIANFHSSKCSTLYCMRFTHRLR